MVGVSAALLESIDGSVLLEHLVQPVALEVGRRRECVGVLSAVSVQLAVDSGVSSAHSSTPAPVCLCP